VLVDQTSGRLKIGQRLGGELHQALEAKEGVKIHPRQQVAKKITIQSLIRPYEHLAGMTGTAWEARGEFRSVYSMKTVRFSPRLEDQTDFRQEMVFLDSDARWNAVAHQIEEEHQKGRPVLVGTRSVEASEHLSDVLQQRDIEHEVLNAVNHKKEAEIIAEAGQRGKVTVATNMAGRGAEIKLGEDVQELGGLHVLGTERHTLHRLDRQLAGRTGRRGQPGSVQFCACVEDDVFQAVPERSREKLQKKYGGNGQLVPPRKVKKLIRNAQSQFSDHYSRVRKQLLVKDLAQEEGDKILFGQDKL
jgi:preprotein translocase subunit SecA